MNIAETPKLHQHNQYHKVREIIGEIKDQNLLTHGAGFCWGMSDLIYQRLQERGIKCRIAECELTLVCTSPATFTTIGRNALPDRNDQVSTHVVVITEHPTQPLLIDCSISHVLPSPFMWVCALTNNDGTILAQPSRSNWVLTYRSKIGSKYPALHQRNIVERIKLDEELKAGIRRNKLLTGFIIVLGGILATVAFFNRRMITEIELHDVETINKIEKITSRVDRLDEGITKLLREANEKKK